MTSPGLSNHKVIQGKQKVAAFLGAHLWTDRPDLEKRGEQIKGTPFVQFGVKENEKGEIGVISHDGWSIALHANEASFIEHQHRIFANRDKAD